MRVPFIIPDGGGFVKLDAGWIFRYHGPDDEVMTMQYLCAPMEGVTGDLFRQAQRQKVPRGGQLLYAVSLADGEPHVFPARAARDRACAQRGYPCRAAAHGPLRRGLSLDGGAAR